VAVVVLSRVAVQAVLSRVVAQVVLSRVAAHKQVSPNRRGIRRNKRLLPSPLFVLR